MYGDGLQGTSNRSQVVSPKAARFRKSNQSYDSDASGGGGLSY
jgi:hypothetical protein